jgi:membrane protease YdiL (CAAX protease family)
MGIYIEALILYIILFFSGSAAPYFNGGGQESFPALPELVKIILYILPSLALIWYCMLRVKSLKKWGVIPGIKDLVSGLIALPCLLITGFVISSVSSFLGETSPVQIQSPSSAVEWIILCVSCISAAYLEESFFRFYLLARRREMKLTASAALVVSVALFSICHIYEGPWGFLNSLVSGAILSFIFLRYEALHGIAAAHGLYNIAIYVINAVTTQN